MRSQTHTPTILATAALLLASAWLVAGPLNPPAGPVAPTYKTLTEVEPRMAISAANTPGDANSLFRISQPGSYYLTGNITGASGKSGIEIASSNVTFDLMGFSLRGVALSLSGIVADGAREGITIRNGTVASWGESGVNLTGSGSPTSALIERVIVSNNGGAGIRVPSNSVVQSCITRGSGTVGILGSSNVTIRDCTATESGTYGIETIGGSTITNCTASNNTTSGIVTDYGGTITHCSARENGDDGIVGFLGCTIADCTAYDNTGDGIRVTGSCFVRFSNCRGNGAGPGIAAGIHSISSENRIEGNNCSNNDFGIDVDGSGTIIIRNTCAGNTQNWVINPNNIHGPILDRTSPGSPAVIGNSAAGTLGSTDPNANFSY